MGLFWDAYWVKGLFIVESALNLRVYRHYTSIIKNPNWQEATIWLFTSVAKVLSSGRPRINPAGDQSGTQTRERRIGSPTR